VNFLPFMTAGMRSARTEMWLRLEIFERTSQQHV